MEKKVNICDLCRGEVARDKCHLCDRDVYKNCSSPLLLLIANNTKIEISYCKECYAKCISDISGNKGNYKNFWSIDFIVGIEDQFIDYIKKKIVVEGLK